MVDNKTLSCLNESKIDTIEIALRKRKEDFISEGDIESADLIQSTIESLDSINVCDEVRMEWVKGVAGIHDRPEVARGFSMMMRDRARNL